MVLILIVGPEIPFEQQRMGSLLQLNTMEDTATQ